MVLNLVRAGRPLSHVRSVVERSFGNYLGGRAKREQTRELRRLREQADALREQIETGESIVEPEEWARFVKLDGRLKEERRVLKIVARQTEERARRGDRRARARRVGTRRRARVRRATRRSRRSGRG